jgi:hypothetical protein
MLGITLAPAQLQLRYGKCGEFKQPLKQYDPQAKVDVQLLRRMKWRAFRPDRKRRPSGRPRVF